MLYRDASGKVPVEEWLERLHQQEPSAHAKCIDRILRLGNMGYELRRPIADSLRDGIYELRIRDGNVQYRLLYFFSGRNAVVLSHGLTKEG